jgi:hypothetical protein
LDFLSFQAKHVPHPAETKYVEVSHIYTPSTSSEHNTAEILKENHRHFLTGGGVD